MSDTFGNILGIIIIILGIISINLKHIDIETTALSFGMGIIILFMANYIEIKNLKGTSKNV